MDDLESGDRVVGCFIGETPASIVLLYQERRHQAEITRLKRENEDLRKLYTEEKARADKRERQLVWLSDGLDPVCIAGSFYYGATGEIKYDGTPEGLLAAIDEACPEEETR